MSDPGMECLAKVSADVAGSVAARVVKKGYDKFLTWHGNNVQGESLETQIISNRRLASYCHQLQQDLDDVIKRLKATEDVLLGALDRPEILRVFRDGFSIAAETDPGMTHGALSKLVAAMLAAPENSRDAIAIRRAEEAAREVNGGQLMLLALIFTMNTYSPDVAENTEGYTEVEYLAEVEQVIGRFDGLVVDNVDICFLESAGLLQIELPRGRRMTTPHPFILSKLMEKRRAEGENSYPDHSIIPRIVNLHQGAHSGVYGTGDVSVTLPVGWTLATAVDCVMRHVPLDLTSWDEPSGESQ